jgi:hypothetical protein
VPTCPSGKSNYFIIINSKFNFYGVRRAALEWNLILYLEGYITAETLKLPLIGLQNNWE